MTTAPLDLVVDSSSVARAAIDLDALEAAALSAGYAVESLADHTAHQAHQSGLMQAQIGSEIAALLRQEGVIRTTTTSTHQATEAMHNFRFGMANVAAQFQDIAVTSQMGMNPMTIALQQGTQLSAVLQAQGGSLRGIGAMLRDAFVSIISPVSLVTIGIVAATAATIQWAGANMKWGQSAEDMLDNFFDKLEKVTDGYKEASQLVNDLRERSGRLSVGAIEVSLGKSLSDAEKGLVDFRREAGNVAAAFRTTGRDVDQAFADMIDSYLEGRITASQFETEVAKAAATNITFFSSFDDAQLQRFSAQLLEGAKMAKVYENALVDISHIIATVKAEEAPYGLGVALQSMIEGEKSAEAHQIEMDAIQAKSPAQLADIARRRESLALREEEISESLRQQKIDEAASEAYASASFEIAESQRARLRAAQDNVEQSELELRLIGRGVSETTRLRFVREELTAAEEEAHSQGISVSQDYIRAIEMIGAQYGALQQKIAEQGAIGDILFARSQMGRSDSEARIAESLREIYGEDFADQMNGFIANQMRVNDALSQMDQLGSQITQTMVVGFMDEWREAFLDSDIDEQALRIQHATDLLTEAQARGIEITEQQRLEIVRLSLTMTEAETQASMLQRAWDSAWEAMGQTTVKVFDQIADKALGLAADGIWDMIFGALSGAVTGGGGAGGWGMWKLPGHANGVDSAPAGLAWVGERGPELLNFRGGESVHSATQSASIAGSRSVTNIFQIDAPGAQLGFEQRFSEMMDTWARANWSVYSGMYAENNTRIG